MSPCNLPGLPDSAFPQIDFPETGDVTVKRDDYVNIIAHVLQMRDWIIAADGCMRGQQALADQLNAFIRDNR